MEVIPLNEDDRIGITVDEAAKILGIGKNLMLKIVTLPEFPAIRLKRKIIINKNRLQQWFDENSGSYGNYKY